MGARARAARAGGPLGLPGGGREVPVLHLGAVGLLRGRPVWRDDHRNAVRGRGRLVGGAHHARGRAHRPDRAAAIPAGPGETGGSVPRPRHCHVELQRRRPQEPPVQLHRVRGGPGHVRGLCDGEGAAGPPHAAEQAPRRAPQLPLVEGQEGRRGRRGRGPCEPALRGRHEAADRPAGRPDGSAEAHQGGRGPGRAGGVARGRPGRAPGTPHQDGGAAGAPGGGGLRDARRRRPRAADGPPLADLEAAGPRLAAHAGRPRHADLEARRPGRAPCEGTPRRASGGRGLREQARRRPRGARGGGAAGARGRARGGHGHAVLPVGGAARVVCPRRSHGPAGQANRHGRGWPGGAAVHAGSGGAAVLSPLPAPAALRAGRRAQAGVLEGDGGGQS
mmetsp:Transcript_55338/g.157551  ORF Transcript_55338/g.157551 Transcript_55338/m.157551 type:complete len:391 (+) Transcript_55338:500-1672(+)